MGSGTGKKLERQEPPVSRNQSDPFAVDFFDSNSVVRPKKKSTVETPVSKSAWHAALPKVNPELPHKYLGFAETPYWIEDAVIESISGRIEKVSKISSDQIGFRVIGFDRTRFDFERNALSRQGNVLTEFQACGEIGLIALSRIFASDIIDTVLKGDVSETRAAADLTNVEQTIFKFLVSEALGEFNENSPDECRLELLGFGSENDGNEYRSDAVEIVGDLVIGGVSGMLTILLPVETVQRIGRTFEHDKARNIHSNRIIDRLGQNITGIAPRVAVATASLTIGELKYLEKGDVVLCEEAVSEFWSSRFNETVASVGIGGRFVVSGLVSQLGNENLAIRIDDVLLSNESAAKRIGYQGEPEKVMANEKFDDIGLDALEDVEGAKATSDEKNRVDLDSVTVDLKVRFAGRKISLSELASLQNGQVLELGCKPEDPVEIVAENNGRPIAAGQLVKIEDQLGVRITRVFV